MQLKASISHEVLQRESLLFCPHVTGAMFFRSRCAYALRHGDESCYWLHAKKMPRV